MRSSRNLDSIYTENYIIGQLVWCNVSFVGKTFDSAGVSADMPLALDTPISTLLLVYKYERVKIAIPAC